MGKAQVKAIPLERQVPAGYQEVGVPTVVRVAQGHPDHPVKITVRQTWVFYWEDLGGDWGTLGKQLPEAEPWKLYPLGL